ncbi:MAG TPA: serpin family protein [Polyangiaceae bacterium]|nr:serpin family protein [Polyangiaceae bacterium]
MRKTIFAAGGALLALLGALGCNTAKKAAEGKEHAGLSTAAVADARALAVSSNTFGLELFEQLRGPAGNLVFAPAGLFSALTPLACGSRGETAAELNRVLRLTSLAQGPCSAARAALSPGSGLAALHSATRLFAEQQFELTPEFSSALAASFIERVSYRAALEPARHRINAWTAEQTEGKIAELLQSGSIDVSTRLVLVSALHFRAAWATPFKTSATSIAAFHTTADASVDVPMMHQVGDFAFVASDGMKLIQLPYAGDEAVLTLLLPDDPAGSEALERRLTTALLDGWTNAAKRVSVSVTMPSFTIASGGSAPISEQLRALGMKRAFSTSADFTGIAAPTPEGPLSLSNVFHQAFIRVDEAGTEAAAGSAASLVVRGLPPVSNTTFRADHPFVFLLRNVQTGLVLFMGRVTDPSASR